ncbi:MAG TPA: sigma-70 family RNA polymerase sigma factor [Candidatus Acidoferrales bacterium]
MTRTTIAADKGDPDLVLVESALQGDNRAFEALVRHNEKRVYRTTLAITANPADAEEAMQETFIKAFVNLASFRRDSRFSTWITRIAVNESLQILRRRRPTDSLDDPQTPEAMFRPQRIEIWGDPERRFAAQQVKEIVEHGIAALPRTYRVAIVLRDIEQLSNDEAAQALGLSVPALKSRVLRARLMLREALAEKFQNPPTLRSRLARAAGMMRHMMAMPFERPPRGSAGKQEGER